MSFDRVVWMREWYQRNKKKINDATKIRRLTKPIEYQTQRLTCKARNPKRWAYNQQRATAKYREIEFSLTFAEWCDWWGEDFARRGRTTGDLVMARFNDTGPYALDNIEKITANQNTTDYNVKIRYKGGTR